MNDNTQPHDLPRSDPEVLELFDRHGVWVRDQHLVYRSGKHGSEYVNKDALYPHPAAISACCRKIAEHFRGARIEAVLAPALGGIVLTQWIAHHLGQLSDTPVLALFAEKAQDAFVLKRGYAEQVTSKRTLIAEDVLTTGLSVKRVVELARTHGAEVVGVGALCKRGQVTAEGLGVKELFCLAHVQLAAWDAHSCPLCQKGVPISTTLGAQPPTQNTPNR